MSLQERFDAAALAVKNLTEKPNNDELLKLYALFKQAKSDVEGSQPWAVQVEARAKWDAWAALKGTSQDSAKEQYVAFVEELKKKYPSS